MKKINTIKILDKDIATHFGTTQQTLMNWKRSSDIKIQRRYKAYKSLYISFINSFDEVQQNEMKKNKAYFHKIIENENIFDNLRIN